MKGTASSSFTITLESAIDELLLPESKLAADETETLHPRLNVVCLSAQQNRRRSSSEIAWAWGRIAAIEISSHRVTVKVHGPIRSLGDRCILNDNPVRAARNHIRIPFWFLGIRRRRKPSLGDDRQHKKAGNQYKNGTLKSHGTTLFVVQSMVHNSHLPN